MRCPFCKCDPFHYVDNGIGYEPVAVTCCEEGISLIQYGNKFLRKILVLRSSHSPRKKARAARMWMQYQGEEASAGGGK